MSEPDNATNPTQDESVTQNSILKKRGGYFTISLRASESDKIHSAKIPAWMPYAAACVLVFTVIGLCVSTYSTGKVIAELRQTSETLEKSWALNTDLKEKMQQLDSKLIEEKNKLEDNEAKFKQMTLEQRAEYMEKLEYYNERATAIEQELNDLRDLKNELENSITKSKSSSSGAKRTIASLNTVLTGTGMGGPEKLTDSENLISEGSSEPETLEIQETQETQEAQQEAKKYISERSLYVNYNFLDTRVKKEIEEYSYLINNINDLKTLMSIQPSDWPVRGVVTSESGIRNDPFTGETTSHSGMDIAVPEGTPVRVTYNGTVVFAGETESYGMLVIVTHADGMQTYYGHNSELLVDVGEWVEKGQVVSKSGNTGRSTGPHVHYEVRVDGVVKDPRDYMNAN